MSHADRIQQLLSQRPGLKARQIAEALEIDRGAAAAALRELGEALVQDSAYRWWPAAREPAAPIGSAAPRTLLARLCRYFLECLSRESGTGASVPADQAGSGYVELDALPFAAPVFGQPRTADRAVRRIIQKARRERGQLALYVGYAVRVRTLRLGVEEETRIEPLLLYPIEDSPEGRGDLLRPASGIPLFNLEVLKSLPSADSGNLIDEAIHLSEELGLANAEDDLPQWDEIIPRLERCRPEWDWKETLDPHRLSQGPPLAELAPGIYNRAVLFAGGRSPFTYGLENELRKLEQLDDEAVRDTALGAWLRGGSIDAREPEDRPLLELLPLNTEQRQAVLRGLSAPLTVVTGPPGTGKSQVVISLLANSAWQRQSVLFASKNNHAVDVVEERANRLGPHPLLLRLGKEEHHARLAQELTASLAQSSGADDVAGYAWLARVHEETGSRFAAVQREIAAVVALRNQVDELERAAEPARAALGEARFAESRGLAVDEVRLRVEAFAEALEAAGSGGTAVARLLGDPSRGRRLRRAAEAAREIQADAERLGAAFPAGAPDEVSLEAWAEASIAR